MKTTDYRLTPEQVATLEPFEKNFASAIRSNYCSAPGRDALERMHAILDSVLGRTTRLNASCGNCVLDLVRDLAAIYFATTGKTPDIVSPRKRIVNRNGTMVVEILPVEAEKKAVEEAEAPKPKTTPKKAPTAKTAKPKGKATTKKK